MGVPARCTLQRGNAVKRRKFVISEDQVNSIMFKRGQKPGSGLNQSDFTNEIFSFEELLNELRVPGIVLQQQNSERRAH